VRESSPIDTANAVEIWNVLLTAHEGRRPELFAALRGRGTFRGSGYRNVAVGCVADVAEFLDALKARLETEPALQEVLARVVPIDRWVPLDPLDPLATLEPAVRQLASRFAGGTFHVRVERRGLKGTLNTAELERTGEKPRVAFRDADRILAVETLGEQAGLGVIDRAMRARWPFVRVD
jgi:tRNA(Ser,Leu) C12 N-acetylase TAN1